jgi:hypothetical protein
MFILKNTNQRIKDCWPPAPPELLAINLMRSFPQMKAAKDAALLHKTKSMFATKLAVPVLGSPHHTVAFSSA